MKFLKNTMHRINAQTALVSFCILAVCIGTQQIQTVAWNTGIIEFARDSLGVLMAVIILSNYKRSDFIKYKVFYIVWTGAGILAAAFILPAAFQRRLDFLKADTVIIALGIFLMGFCIIHTFISFFAEKYRPKFYLPLFLIWFIMMVLMIFSKSDYLWPECYFVLFLCYYLTPQTPVQRRNVTAGLLNGMILSFILIQSHALLCRPYDRIRYQGNFCNPNNNCLFLCLCLAAILAKILFLARENGKKPLRIFLFLLAGACYSFICMTMGRSGYLATFVITVFFLAAYCRIKGAKIFIRTGLFLVSLFIVMLPITYCAVRYIPTIHPHVLFYYQEGYSEDFVHSWDSWDSEKYISFQEMLEGMFGRFETLKNSYDSLQNESSSEELLPSEEPASGQGQRPAMVLASASGRLPFPMQAGSAVNQPEPKVPILSEEETENSLLVRYTIYKWFFTHLSLRGMPYEEQGLQVAEGYWVQHAHSIYLDYGINFGYPVMILFTVFIWWGMSRLSRQGLRTKDPEKLACLLFALVPAVFGLFEFAWGAGMISTVLLYLSFKEMFCQCAGTAISG